MLSVAPNSPFSRRFRDHCSILTAELQAILFALKQACQSKPQISLSLTKYKKDTTNPEVYKQAFLEITSRHQNYVQIFTDGSKVDEKVAAAAVSSADSNSPFSCRLRDHCSIYTAELQAILFALKPINPKKGNS